MHLSMRYCVVNWLLWDALDCSGWVIELCVCLAWDGIPGEHGGLMSALFFPLTSALLGEEREV
jgi:hypothetical protein